MGVFGQDTATLVAISLQIVGHFLFHQFLDQPLDAQTNEAGRDVSFSIQAVAQQIVQFLANLLT